MAEKVTSPKLKRCVWRVGAFAMSVAALLCVVRMIVGLVPPTPSELLWMVGMAMLFWAEV